MVSSIEIWNEGFNLFEVTDTTDVVTTHTGTTIDVTGTLSDFTYKKKIIILTNG